MRRAKLRWVSPGTGAAREPAWKAAIKPICKQENADIEMPLAPGTEPAARTGAAAPPVRPAAEHRAESTGTSTTGPDDDAAALMAKNFEQQMAALAKRMEKQEERAAAQDERQEQTVSKMQALEKKMDDQYTRGEAQQRQLGGMEDMLRQLLAAQGIPAAPKGEKRVVEGGPTSAPKTPRTDAIDSEL